MREIKKDKNKFYIGENSQNALAEITFVPDGEGKIIVNHTYVSVVFKRSRNSFGISEKGDRVCTSRKYKNYSSVFLRRKSYDTKRGIYRCFI